MKRQAYESVFTLYDSDNQVTICETRREAEATKRRFSRLVTVEGPFEHPRHELPLVVAAAHALKVLREMQLHSDVDRASDLREARNELELAIRKVFPFRSVHLKDGRSFDFDTGNLDESR
ncbi:MAG: hypothetical protein V1790_05625 [Planctomycetota bacterium]